MSGAAIRFTLRELVALAKVTGPAADLPDRTPSTPPIFVRLGLEDVVHPPSVGRSDLTAQLSLRASRADADRWWASTTAPGMAALLAAPAARELLAAYLELESEPSDGLLAASVFLTLDWTRPLAEQRAQCIAVARSLLDEPSAHRIADQIERGFEALSLRLRVYHFGLMLGRRGTEARWVLLGPRRHLLEHAGQAVGRARVTEALAGMPPGCHLSLQSVVGVADRVGIEMAPALDLSGTERARQWTEIVSFVLSRGWMGHATAKALETWPGSSIVRAERQHAELHVARALSHVKLSVSRNRVESVKIYRTITPDWRDAPSTGPGVPSPSAASPPSIARDR